MSALKKYEAGQGFLSNGCRAGYAVSSFQVHPSPLGPALCAGRWRLRTASAGRSPLPSGSRSRRRRVGIYSGSLLGAEVGGSCVPPPKATAPRHCPSNTTALPLHSDHHTLRSCSFGQKAPASSRCLPRGTSPSLNRGTPR